MEMLAMGKYGVYVWTCFGLTFTVLVTCVVQARRRHRAVLREVRRHMQLTETDE